MARTTTFRLHLAAGLTAALLVGGCGDDDSAQPAADAPVVTQAPATTSTETTPPPADAEEPAPAASDGSTISDEQKLALLSENNEIAAGGTSFREAPPLYAANYRKYAESLDDGACKKALLDVAKTWDEIADAYASGAEEKAKDLGVEVSGSSFEIQKGKVCS